MLLRLMSLRGTGFEIVAAARAWLRARGVGSGNRRSLVKCRFRTFSFGKLSPF